MGTSLLPSPKKPFNSYNTKFITSVKFIFMNEMVASASHLSSVACPMASAPVICMTPFPVVPTLPFTYESMMKEYSSEFCSSQRYNLCSLSKQPIGPDGGLGISSSPKYVKVGRGRQSHMSKAIHKASLDAAKGRKLYIDRVLRARSNLDMVTK